VTKGIGNEKGGIRHIKEKIRYRRSIEPIIGFMKSVGKMGKNWLKGKKEMRPMPFCVLQVTTFAWVLLFRQDTYTPGLSQNAPTTSKN
jgi:hypothetical protein